VKRLGWILLGFFGCIVLIYLVRRSAKVIEEVIEEERGITLTQQAFMPLKDALEERIPTMQPQIRAYTPTVTTRDTISVISPSPSYSPSYPYYGGVPERAEHVRPVSPTYPSYGGVPERAEHVVSKPSISVGYH